ncbi:hypothetical protein LV779_34260 [Streptomyces thinghirensis]|nr:hypothetical protein [Streptomyces thinghirensis]
MQHRVVVFVHPSHLTGPDAPCLTSQASADQRGAADGEKQRDTGRGHDHRDLVLQ